MCSGHQFRFCFGLLISIKTNPAKAIKHKVRINEFCGIISNMKKIISFLFVFLTTVSVVFAQVDLPKIEAPIPKETLAEMLSRIFANIRLGDSKTDNKNKNTKTQKQEDKQQGPTLSNEEYLLNLILPASSKIEQVNTEPTKRVDCPKVVFDKTFYPGARNEQVKFVQEFLNMNKKTAVAQKGPGSKGSETDYFGPATKKAVMKFQELFAKEILEPVGLSRPTGVWGPATYSFANKVLDKCHGKNKKTPR